MIVGAFCSAPGVRFWVRVLLGAVSLAALVAPVFLLVPALPAVVLVAVVLVAVFLAAAFPAAALVAAPLAGAPLPADALAEALAGLEAPSCFDRVLAGDATDLAAVFALPAAACRSAFMTLFVATSAVRAADFSLASLPAPFKGERADRFCAADADVRAAALPTEAEFRAEAFDAGAGAFEDAAAGFEADGLEAPFAATGLPELASDPVDGVRGIFAVAGLVLGGIAHS